MLGLFTIMIRLKTTTVQKNPVSVFTLNICEQTLFTDTFVPLTSKHLNALAR